MYKIVRLIALIFFKLFSRLHVEGHDQLPENEAFILAPNHLSNLDVFILSAAVKNEFYTLSKKELFKNPFLRFLITRLNGIPVNRKGFCRQSLKAALDILQQKKAMVVFPEGYVSNNGTLGRFKQGVARLALEAKVPIIPVAIIGSNRVLPLGKRIPRPHRVIVKFGEPIYFDSYEEGYDRKIKNEVTENVRNEILELIISEGTS
ncbi:MAG: lysophospholipid acyltransferase family protein [bacterium]|nr:lysophospholipid acyltransferase family protein [bacterium]